MNRGPLQSRTSFSQDTQAPSAIYSFQLARPSHRCWSNRKFQSGPWGQCLFLYTWCTIIASGMAPQENSQTGNSYLWLLTGIGANPLAIFIPATTAAFAAECFDLIDTQVVSLTAPNSTPISSVYFMDCYLVLGNPESTTCFLRCPCPGVLSFSKGNQMAATHGSSPSFVGRRRRCCFC